MSSLKEKGLEVLVIHVKVTVTLPQKETITSAHRLWKNKADINKHLNALLNDFLLDLLVVSVAGDLFEDGLLDVLLHLVIDFIFEYLQAAVSNQWHITVAQKVTIEVIECTIDTLCENDEFAPNINEILKQALSACAAQFRLDFLRDIYLDEIFLDVADLLIVVVYVTLVDDDLVNLHELLVRAHTCRFVSQILAQLRDVVVRDEGSALIDIDALAGSGHIHVCLVVFLVLYFYTQDVRNSLILLLICCLKSIL